MPNMKRFIQNYSSSLLSKHTAPIAVHLCVCRRKSECLLDNGCLLESLVPKAAASQTPSQIIKFDYGTCAKTSNNNTTIILLYLENTKPKSTELSKHN